ncbi:MAG TPA: tRNA lysidine(34) synthetase TilS [Acidisarcina sp.]|nr:tRNA lysidine(34) synthetase TilS [Acidisarcina sp.]
MSNPAILALNTSLFRPGMRVAVAVSGGADSVALLRALLERARELGLVLSVAHVHHGLRGADADADEAFVCELARVHDLEFHLHRCDTPAAASANGEGIEEAARNLRYDFFRGLLASRQVDAVATAHTLDDQAETVLLKLIRGAWTEGLGGIYPIYEVSGEVSGREVPVGGRILRPMLAVRRAEVEAFLRERHQDWREDASNRELIYSRNRIRHQLLPALREYNPGVEAQLAALSAIARDEEAYWQAELAKLLPSLLLPGKPVRGGGRASSTHPGEKSLSIELERLRSLHPALRRRVLRAALSQLGVSVGFDPTEELAALCNPSAGEKLPPGIDLPGGVRARRSARELRLEVVCGKPPATAQAILQYVLPVPGEVFAEAFGLHFRCTCQGGGDLAPATVRPPLPGDRVRLRYTRGPKRMKEVFERMHIAAPDRTLWPVVEWRGEVVWMRGVELEPELEAALKLEISAETAG